MARRLDRLALRAHAFHRFAHHPLCGAYEREVIRLGRRTRLCRGCTLGIAGMAGGAAAGLVLPFSPWVLGAAVAGLGAGVLGLRLRLPKGASRLLPLGAIALAVVSAARAGAWMVGAGLACVTTIALAAYHRRGPDRAPCVTCPARAESPCPGLAPIVRRERAFGRLAARILDQSVSMSSPPGWPSGPSERSTYGPVPEGAGDS